VLPVLSRFGYPAVVFVPSDFIGGRNSFDLGNEPDEPICNWEDLRDLERNRISIQSHGATHRALSPLQQNEQEDELRRSKSVLEASLGTPIEVFSFPYGDGGTDAEAMTNALKRSGYRAACLYGGGPNTIPIADAYRLARVAMGPDTDLKAILERD
jgi:peptidoglycan/xylan/chitin deacetylase (PgdA/CDA1 family)